jgi:predicted ArsR family transcriptional regulator
MTNQILSTDQSLLDLLRNEGPLSIRQMVDELGVTATAVRQRLTRLSSSGLIDRNDQHVGRGRPVHQYSLSKEGVKFTGNNLDDLARVLWEEIQEISDQSIRKQVLRGVVQRLSEKYCDLIEGESIDDRLQSIARLFSQREIPFTVKTENGKHVLKIVGCPYPGLVDGDNEICEMERQLLSRLTNQELTVARHQCGKSGQCCTFQSTELLEKK